MSKVKLCMLLLIIPSFLFALTGGKFINIVDRGADNTGSTDATSIINNAIKDLYGHGGVVYLPAGAYKISSTIQLGDGSSNSNNIHIIGEGLEVTRLVFDSYMGRGIHIKGRPNSKYIRESYQNKLKDFSMVAFAQVLTGIDMGDAKHSSIENVKMWADASGEWTTGINIKYSNNKVLNSKIINCVNGITVSNWFNHIIGCEIRGYNRSNSSEMKSTYGIHLDGDGINGTVITRNVVDCFKEGIRMEKVGVTTIITNNGIGDNSYYGINMLSGNGVLVSGNEMEGNGKKSWSGNGINIGSGVKGIKISSNYFNLQGFASGSSQADDHGSYINLKSMPYNVAQGALKYCNFENNYYMRNINSIPSGTTEYFFEGTTMGCFPTEKREDLELDVNGNARISGDLELSGDQKVTGEITVEKNSTDHIPVALFKKSVGYSPCVAITDGSDGIRMEYHNSTGKELRIQKSDGQGLWKGNLMTIEESGEVGIGTENPSEKLHVEGTVKAQKISIGTVNNLVPVWSNAVGGYILKVQ